MKRLAIPFIPALSTDLPALPAWLDEQGIPFTVVDTVNWPAYPYRPDVRFRMVHTDNALVLHYVVTEQSVKAEAGRDNGPVWEDACVEFFSVPANDGIYYNLECNCAGQLLVAAGTERNDREFAPPSVLQGVKRWSSLGRESFPERVGECTWQVVLYVPLSTFFKHGIASLRGQTIRANFYKCGDKLMQAHFLSWNPIPIEQPDFHRPDCFGILSFN
ncbi:MAG: hypothetical protein HUJ99_08625 [Bacteroidaceae bacterium]|nr:hypothetical protein [Bacteroidaceae bacterium]